MREVSATLGYVPNITDCFFCNCIFEYFSGRSSFILALEQQQQQQQQRINLEKTLSFFAVSIKCVEITKLMNLDKVSIK